MFHLDETQRHSSLTKRNFSLFHHHRSHYHYCHHSLILAKFSNLFSSIHFTSFNLSFSSINIFFIFFLAFLFTASDHLFIYFTTKKLFPFCVCGIKQHLVDLLLSLLTFIVFIYFIP